MSWMIINGAIVDDALVPALVTAVKNATLAHKLQTAHRFHTEAINLSDADRRLLLEALDEGPERLEELRGQLLEHPAWRPRQRLM